MCRRLRPRSSTSVFSPRSVSSFAAQPPDMPEPTTMASNVFAVVMSDRPGLLFGRERNVALIPAGNTLVSQGSGGADLRVKVTGERVVLQDLEERLVVRKCNVLRRALL